MADQEVTHTLVRLDGVTARQVNQNFRDVTEFVNGQTVHTDGTGLSAALSAVLVWQSWTPTLTAATTNPTLGTGSSASGRFLRVGELVVANAVIRFGTSGTNAGNGLYNISLPVDAAEATTIGSGYLYDSSTFTPQVCSVVRENFVASEAFLMADNVFVGHNDPWAWTNSDVMSFHFVYEAA